ncbi:MAG: hypothetical protein AAB019_04290, partial [Planctomycetota bacterium]
MFAKIAKFVKKREKLVLFVIVIVIALGFGITGSMIALLEDRGENAAGTIFGKKITKAEFTDVATRWAGYLALVDLNIQPMYRSWYYKNVPPLDMVGYLPASPMSIGESARFDSSRQYLEDLTWWVFVLMEECNQIGIRTEEKEVSEHIKNNIFAHLVSPEGDFNYEEYRVYVNQKLNITEAQFEKMISELLAIQKYRQLVNLAVAAPLDKVYEKYLEEQTKINLKCVVFDVDDYQAVPPGRDSEEIIQYFKNNQNKYRVDEKIQIEYLLADSETLKKKITEPSPEELDKYYKQHQDEYQITPPAGQLDQKPQYRPFDEVKESIKTRIISGRAMDLAEEEIRKVNQQITDLILERKTINLKQLAQDSGLVYSQTGFFNRERIAEIAGKEIGFSDGFEADIFNYPLKQISHTMQTSRGYLIFQVLAKQPGYLPKLTVQLKKNILQELKERKVRGLVKEAIDKLDRALKEKLDEKLKESTAAITPELKNNLSRQVFTSVTTEQ